MRPLGGRIPPDGAFLAARILSDGWTAELDFENIAAGTADPTKVSGQITLPSVDIIGVPMSGTRTLAGVTSNINPWYDSDWPFPSQADAGGVLTIPVRLDQPVRDTDVVTISVTAGIVANARAGTVTATNSSTLQHLNYVENLYSDVNSLVGCIDCATGCRQTTGFKIPGVDALPTGVSLNAGTGVITIAASSVDVNGWDFSSFYVRTSGTRTGIRIFDNIFDTANASASAVAPLDFFSGATDWYVTFNTFSGTVGTSSTSSINTRVTVFDGGTILYNQFENMAQDPLSLRGGSASVNMIIRSNWSKSGGFLSGAHFDCITFSGGYGQLKYNLCDQRTYGTQYGKNNYTRIGGSTTDVSYCDVIGNVGIGKAGDVAGFPFQSSASPPAGATMSNVSVMNNAFVPLDTGDWYHGTEQGIIACSGNYDPFDNIALPNIPPF